MKLNPLAGASSRLRRGLVLGTAACLTTGAVFAVTQQASAAAGCKVAYTTNGWSNGFTANVAITNLGDQMSSWKLEFDFAGNQKISQAWNGQYTQSGQHVTLSNMSWNGSLAGNATITPGFQATFSGTNTDPTSFKLNGVTCNGGTGPTSTGPTSTGPTSTGPTSHGPTPPPGTHVDNPYVGVKGYVNPEWKAKADAEPGGSKISSNPTGLWLDRIEAIEGTKNSSSNGSMGLKAHLDEAVKQGAGYIQLVIYNLPGRDCSALASNGQLKPTEIERYKTEYIDPIAALEADPKYKDLRIINIIEIDSLPNLVTNVSPRETKTETCDVMKANGNYEKGIAYALGTLKAAGSNIYNYIDSGHHGWIGWEDNFNASANKFLETAKMATGGVATVDGFITNTANYSALEEPYLKELSTKNPQAFKQTKWIDWNPYMDELGFAKAMRDKLASIGFDSKIGMLIDTSRNGWGGAKRPTKASTASDLNTAVEESRIDRRIQSGNWCNQVGAGIGERPKAAPSAGIDAYVWIKPPGESDGSSKLIDNNEGKGFDGMCDPKYTGNPRNNNSMSGAMDGAPISGAWFSAQFRELLANAYPAL